jgi:hypothetical protein
MTLRITIEIGEKEHSEDGELLHADIKKRIEFEPFGFEILEGYESEAINRVREVLREIKTYKELNNV